MRLKVPKAKNTETVYVIELSDLMDALQNAADSTPICRPCPTTTSESSSDKGENKCNTQLKSD